MSTDKKVYCTAGINYCLMYPNGDVYRCMADYNAKRPPLFNAKNKWQLNQKPELCTHDKCYAACDIDWSTKWIYEGDSLIVKKAKALIGELDKNNGRFWSDIDMQGPFGGNICVIWAPTLLCNYGCKYCGCAKGSHQIYKDFSSSGPEISAKEWLGIWQNIRSKYNLGVINITGGEPLLSKSTLPVIELMTDKFFISLTTNLSTGVMDIVRDNIRIGLISASFHPTDVSFNKDVFLSSVLYLKEHNYKIRVTFVAYPLQLFLARGYKKLFKSHDISFVVSPWCGTDNSGFESKYTITETRFLKKILPWYRQMETQTEFISFKYDLKLNTDSVDVEERSDFILNGKIKNTGSQAWRGGDLSDNEAVKIGIRISPVEDRKKVVKDFRYVLPKPVVVPGDSFDFEIKVPSEDLETGFYTAKIDLLKESLFWFEEKGNFPGKLKINIRRFPFACEIIKVELQKNSFSKQDARIYARLAVKNSGDMEWFVSDSNKNIKIGCRLFKDTENLKGQAVKEYRFDILKPVAKGEIIRADMNLDFQGIEPGSYTLVFDVVNEGKYWFSDRASKPAIKKIRINNE